MRKRELVDATAVASAGATLPADALQLNLTRQILQKLGADGPDRRSVEAKNIFERWLLAMVNSSAPAVSVYKVYRVTAAEDPANEKLRSELVEKRIAKPAQARALVDDVLELVACALAVKPEASDEVVGCNDKALTYVLMLNGKSFEYHARLDSVAEKLIRIGGCTATVAASLRYAVLAPGGQQWGIPQAHIDYLYDLGVRNEAFASPFNSHLLGKKDATFCSAFPDTDAAFGSLGDFFALEPARTPPGGWVVNPPFVEELLRRAARRCLAMVRAGHAPVFFIMPAWHDCAAYALLRDSKYCAAEVALAPGNYYYEEPSGRRVDTRAASVYFALAPVCEPAAEAGQRAKYREALEHITRI
jgi:hypothetical protein